MHNPFGVPRFDHQTVPDEEMIARLVTSGTSAHGLVTHGDTLAVETLQATSLQTRQFFMPQNDF
jgi:hypothetical protein